MYSKLPNLVIGFHGCDESSFNKVVRRGEAMTYSTNPYDWLGHGIYFWEQSYDRARTWAQQQKRRGEIEKPAVIGAVIDLGHCLNLTDSEYIDLLAREYKLLFEEAQAAEIDLPENEGKTEDKLFRNLDCAVIEHLHNRLEQEKKNGHSTLAPFDSARALFVEGEPIYKGAGFQRKTHIQICVRNPNCIKGYFEPRKILANWTMP